METNFPQFEIERYESIINKDIKWLKENLDNKYIHIHSNGIIEKKEAYLKNLSSSNINFQHMKPLNWMTRKDKSYFFITGLSNFKLKYFEKYLDLNLVYHSIWKLEEHPKCFSWQATKVS